MPNKISISFIKTASTNSLLISYRLLENVQYNRSSSCSHVLATLVEGSVSETYRWNAEMSSSVVTTTIPSYKKKRRIKKEEQMLKWSIFTILTGFLCSHLPHIINHCEYLSYFIPWYNRMITQVQAVLDSVTLREGTGHSHWYQNVECSHAYHHTKCERDQFILYISQNASQS